MSIRVNPKTDQTVSYVPVTERGTDNPVRIEMRKLPRKVLAEIRDEIVVLNQRGKFSGLRNDSTTVKTVTLMMNGWENVFDMDGKPLTFDTSKRSEMYDILPREMQEDLEAKFGRGSLDWEKAEAELAKAEAELAAEANEDSGDQDT